MVHKEMRDCQQLLCKAQRLRKSLLDVILKRTNEGFSCVFFCCCCCFLVLFCVFWIVCAYTKHTNIKFDATVIMPVTCHSNVPVLPGFNSVRLLSAENTGLFS